MEKGDEVLVEEDHGNILWEGFITDTNDVMLEVCYTSGPLEGFHQWREVCDPWYASRP